MTLATHAIVGAAAASLFPEMPVAAFAAGFLSHFLCDSIPHWDEGRMLLRSPVEDPKDPLKFDMHIGRDFIHDIAIICSDGLLGLLLSILIFHVYLFQLPVLFVVIGAAAGMLPDALQFVYFKTHWWVMTPLQRFHIWLQKEYENPAMLLIEVGLVVSVITLLKWW